MKNNRNRLFSNGLFYIVVFLFLLWGINFLLGGQSSSGATENISYSEFVKDRKAGEVKSFIVQPSIGVYAVTGTYTDQDGVKQRLVWWKLNVKGDWLLHHDVGE